MKVELETPQTVAYQVASVEIPTLIVSAIAGDHLAVLAPFHWLDGDGKVVREGVHRYQDAGLRSLLGEAYAPFKAAILGLAPSGAFRQIRLAVGEGVTGFALAVIDGRPAQVRLTEAAIAAALVGHGLTLEALRGIVRTATVAILEN